MGATPDHLEDKESSILRAAARYTLGDTWITRVYDQTNVAEMWILRFPHTQRDLQYSRAYTRRFGSACPAIPRLLDGES